MIQAIFVFHDIEWRKMDLFNILRDSDKLQIILLLLNNEICVCDLEKVLNLKQSTLSNKLRMLRQAGIIDVRKDKNWRYYSINQSFYNENIKLIEYIKEKNNTINMATSLCEEKNGN